MTALTTEEVYYIRDNSGDTNVPYDVDEDRIQAIFDSTTEGNSDLDDTVYYVIRRCLGLSAPGTAVTSGETGFNDALNQKFEQYERLFVVWSDITGLGGRPLRMGVISLSIDSVED